MNGYVLDDSALAAGLAGVGDEHHRREFSRLIVDAAGGGPGVGIPALCLAEVSSLRPAVAGHVAALVATSPSGAVYVLGLSRDDTLVTLRSLCPSLDWPGMHAALAALRTNAPILTSEPERYAGIPVNVLPL